MRLFPTALLALTLTTGAAYSATAKDSGPSLAMVADAPDLAKTPELAPLPSGPGLVIGEPTADGGAAQEAFGAGCSRWVEFAAGADPAFGKNVRWDILDRLAQELHRPAPRLTAADLPRAFAVTGATHVALTTLTGDAAHASLRVQVYARATQRPVGEPILLAGGNAAIAQALPTLAARLWRACGLPAKTAPAKNDLSADELALIGKVRRVGGGDHGPDDAALNTLAARSPLAAFAVLAAEDAPDDVAAQRLRVGLLKSSGESPLVLAFLAGIDWQGRPAGLTEAVAQAIKSAPNSYLVHYADFHLRRIGYSLNLPHTEAEFQLAREALAAARLAARCAPDNPAPWLSLSFAASDAANNLRYARTVDAIAPAEWDRLNTLYRLEFLADVRAERLDPHDHYAWRDAATAATFLGDEPVAADALWKGIALNPTDAELYSWGLQMYQPKWFGRADQLAKVARLAADAPYTDPEPGLAIELTDAGFPADAKRFLDRIAAEARTARAKDPKNPRPLMTLAESLCVRAEMGDASALPPALEAAQALVALRPHYGDAQLALLRVYKDQGDTEAAVTAARAWSDWAVADARAPLALGDALRSAGRTDEARAAWQRAASLTGPAAREARRRL